jgi:hypothetical protein
MAAIDLVLLVVAAGAVLFLLYGWSYLRRVAESVEWPRTRGIVVEVSTETFCQTPRGFAPQVEYDYEWEGKTHQHASLLRRRLPIDVFVGRGFLFLLASILLNS